jgi:hypothetical protein
MASLNLAAGASSPSKPDRLETYLLTSMVDLILHTDDLFSRYRAAGVKYHSTPFAVRNSTHLQHDDVDMLYELYSLSTDSRLADCVASTFSDLIWCIAEAGRALEGESQDLGAADSYVFDAFNLAEKLEKRVYATEAAVADVVAIRNSLTEQGQVQTPDPWADAAEKCFEEWAEALMEWTQEMAEMVGEISSDPSGGGMQGIFGLGV